jgi:hypothetical protein
MQKSRSHDNQESQTAQIGRVLLLGLQQCWADAAMCSRNHQSVSAHTISRQDRWLESMNLDSVSMIILRFFVLFASFILPFPLTGTVIPPQDSKSQSRPSGKRHRNTPICTTLDSTIMNADFQNNPRFILVPPKYRRPLRPPFCGC